MAWAWVALMALSPPLMVGSYGPVETSGPNGASLTDVGEKTLTLRDGKHAIKVTLTVGDRPGGWPEAHVVGPTSDEFLGINPRYKIVTDAEITVDGCRIFQPWPPISGMSMPSGAVLSAYEGKWQLEIGGGDGAESYGVRYTFDQLRVLTRDLQWGPDFSETTTYDIQYDPDVSPQQCGG